MACKYVIEKQHGKHVITHPDKHGKVTVYGNGHVKEIFYAIPDWGEEEETAFHYRGETYFLDEFMRIEKHAPCWMHEYDGYMNDSFFSGILIKYTECDYGEYGIKAYTFIG